MVTRGCRGLYGDYMSGPVSSAPVLLSGPFLLFDRAAGFLSPRPRIVVADARSRCQGWSVFATTEGVAFTSASTTACSTGRVDCFFLLLPVRGPWIVDCGFSVDVHVGCDDRISLYPAAPFRLAIMLYAWTIAQAGRDSSLARQTGWARSANPHNSHTSDPPDALKGAPELEISHIAIGIMDIAILRIRFRTPN